VALEDLLWGIVMLFQLVLVDGLEIYPSLPGNLNGSEGQNFLLG